MGAGKVVGGIILIILGIVIYGVASTISNIQSRNIEECNSILGQLGQTLSPEGATQCSKAPLYQSFGGASIFFAVILVIIGIILVIFGALPKKEVIKKFKSEEIREPPIIKSNYCRYCGKTKSSSADYCPSCGRYFLPKEA